MLLQVDMMTNALYDMVRKFAETVPNVFMSVVILLAGFIVAKIVEKIISKVLKNLGIDAVGEKLNEIDIVQKANMNIKISNIAAKVMYYFILLFFVVAATSVLGIPEISNLVSDIFKFIPNLMVALIILIIGTLFADALRKFILTALKSLGVPSAGIIASIFFYFLFINIVVSAMGQAKINTAFLSQNISIILGGIVLAFAIGYGLASKNIMANLLASFYGKDQFVPGSKITIDGVSGTISGVEKSNLIIKTDSGKVIIPLSQAVNQKIEIHD